MLLFLGSLGSILGLLVTLQISCQDQQARKWPQAHPPQPCQTEQPSQQQGNNAPNNVFAIRTEH